MFCIFHFFCLFLDEHIYLQADAKAVNVSNCILALCTLRFF